MRDITPADLARFVHPVPVGATIPAGTPYAYRIDKDALRLRADGWTDPTEQRGIDSARWTAEPLPAPEPTLAERVRSLTRGRVWSPSDLDQLVLIVAELAEKVEGDR